MDTEISIATTGPKWVLGVRWESRQRWIISIIRVHTFIWHCLSVLFLTLALSLSLSLSVRGVKFVLRNTLYMVGVCCSLAPLFFSNKRHAAATDTHTHTHTHTHGRRIQIWRVSFSPAAGYRRAAIAFPSACQIRTPLVTRGIPKTKHTFTFTLSEVSFRTILVCSGFLFSFFDHCTTSSVGPCSMTKNE